MLSIVVGTPYYLSPELCEDKPYNDKSDVWALGVILYECLTFKHPFEARNQCALILKIIKGKFTPIADNHPADERLKELVKICLTHDCSRRPSVSDLLSIWWVQEKIHEYNLDLPDGIARSDTPVLNECVDEEGKEEGVEEEDGCDHDSYDDNRENCAFTNKTAAAAVAVAHCYDENVPDSKAQAQVSRLPHYIARVVS